LSGFRAIGGVSSTLRNLLRDRMEQPVDVTIAPPDVVISGVTRRVNLYLYQVSENGFLKNQEIPGEGHPADYGRPPLSLNLHYLMTCYGGTDTSTDADLAAQQILGDAMRVFHEYPIVTEALHEDDNIGAPLILDANLVGEFEKVKITLHPSTLEEFSKIWTALPQANFRRSVAYQVSVVQIENRRPRRTPRPVRERRVYALPLRTPRIAEIFRDPPFEGVRSAIVEVGDTLVIVGENLASTQSTRVRIGTEIVAIPLPQDRRITTTAPATLQAGVHSVQVIHDLMLLAEVGQPPVAHRGFQSNAVPLLVIPQFAGAAPASAGPGDVVTVTVNPAAGATQRKTLLLGDFEVEAEPVAVTAPPSTTIDFRLPPAGPQQIPAGTYLARVRVDGAESRLIFDEPTQQYTGPNYTVT
jgi:hypothetical protein